MPEWLTFSATLPVLTPSPKLATDYGVLDDMLYVFNYTSKGGPIEVLAFDMIAGTWARLADSPSAVLPWQSQTARIGRYFYLMGETNSAGSGFSPQADKYESLLWRYDVDADAWTQLTGHPTARAGCGVAAALNLIAMWGGCDGNGLGTGRGTGSGIDDSFLNFSDPETGLVEVYDPITDTWDSSWAAMPDPVQYPACASDVLGYVYSFGGVRGTNATTGGIGDASVACYRMSMDPAGPKDWERIADLPSPRAWGIASFANGRIWLYGSRTSKPTSLDGRSFAYTVATDTWDEFEPLAGVTPSGDFAPNRWAYGGARADGVLVLPGDGVVAPLSAFYATPAPHLPTFRYHRGWRTILGQG